MLDLFLSKIGVRIRLKSVKVGLLIQVDPKMECLWWIHTSITLNSSKELKHHPSRRSNKTIPITKFRWWMVSDLCKLKIGPHQSYLDLMTPWRCRMLGFSQTILKIKLNNFGSTICNRCHSHKWCPKISTQPSNSNKTTCWLSKAET